MRLRIATRTLAAAAVAGSLAGVSVGVAHAVDQATPPAGSGSRPSALVRVMARGDFAIERRLRTIDQLKGVVQNDPRLTAQHRDAMSAQLDKDVSALHELRTRIDSAVSADAARRGFDRIKHFHIYNLIVPKVQLLLASDGMGGAALNLHLDLGQVAALLPVGPKNPPLTTPTTQAPATTNTTTPPAIQPADPAPTVPVPANSACQVDPRDCVTATTAPAPSETPTTVRAELTPCQRDPRDCGTDSTPKPPTPVPAPADPACPVDSRDCPNANTSTTAPKPDQPSADEVSNAKDDAAEADVTATDVQNKTETVSDTVVNLSASDFEAARARLHQEREKLAQLRRELERVSDILARVDTLLERLQEALAAFMAPPASTPPPAPTTTPTTAPRSS